MDRVIVEFARVLRRHDMVVSPAEIADAVRSVSAVGVGSRGDVRQALRATLCKHPDDAALFDRLFDVYFSLSGTSGPAGRSGRDHRHAPGSHDPPPDDIDVDDESLAPRGRSDDHGSPTPGLRNFFDKRLLRSTPAGAGEAGTRLRLSLFAEQLALNRREDALDRALRRIVQHLQIRRARGALQPGTLTAASEVHELPLDITANELIELTDELRAAGADDELTSLLDAQAEHIGERLPDLLAALLRRRALLDPDADRREVEQRSLVRVDRLSDDEKRQLEAAVRRLARRLQGSADRRHRRHRVGALDVAHTMRRNLRYEGLPFELAHRRRREQRPRLIVLCDVSRSTRNLARFWLQLIYQLQDRFSNVRTFVYVADLAEVTNVLRARPADRAIEEVFTGELLDVGANSDFGRALAQFDRRHLDAVTRRSSVVVLGDARNNGRDPNVRAFVEISRRARRLLWLTPEPRWAWELGACDLAQYEPWCDRVEIVRTAVDLAGVAERILAVPGGRTRI